MLWPLFSGLSACRGGGERGIGGVAFGLMRKGRGMASLMRRMLLRTSAPIFSSLRRMAPHEARANWVYLRPMRRGAQIST